MPKKPKRGEVPCPACREPISLIASKCPHCQTQFSEQEIGQRKDNYKGDLKAAGCLTLVAFIMILAFCSKPSPTPPVPMETSAAVDGEVSAEATSVAPSDGELEAARKEAIAHWSKISMPSYAPEAPVSALCRSTICEANKVQFERNDWPKAWRGDYQGQRNAAFCRANSCDGAVIVDEVEACAWRLVINSMNAAKADASDTSNLSMNCGRLSDASRDLAASKAEAFIEMIRK